jgi:NitT/TauT family transport system substrate-binding protein
MALESGAIDAAAVTEPMVTRIESEGIGVKLACYQDYVLGYQASAIIFGPNLLDKNPELGKRFMVAYLKGIRQYQEGTTGRNIEILHKYTKLDKETLKKICYISFRNDGRVDTETIRTLQDWTYERGHIDAKVPLEKLVDMSFIQHANYVLK